MTTIPSAQPVPSAKSGSVGAQTSAAAAAIALATAMAGSALLAGIATGTAVEAPDEPAVIQVVTPDSQRAGASFR